MSSWKVSVILLAFSVFLGCRCQQYDFAAEITRQCLVPDPVGLLDCVENKVTLPYLTSWVDCTNSLGQNVKTSADIINYRCKSVWEGKEVIPEVFYIKDCVIEKTGLPAKNVSAEVLGAYKECENNPSPQGQQMLMGQMPAQGVMKTPPIQQQQVIIPASPLSLFQGGIKTVPVQQVQIDTAAVYGQQPVQPVLIAPPQQQAVSHQFFMMYPRPPLLVQQPLLSYPNQITQQQLPVSSYIPQAQAVGKTSYSQPVQQVSQQVVDVPLPTQPVQQVPSGPYYYQFQIRH